MWSRLGKPVMIAWSHWKMTYVLFPPSGGSRHTNCDYKSQAESVIVDWYLDVITAWETARYQDVSVWWALEMVTPRDVTLWKFFAPLKHKYLGSSTKNLENSRTVPCSKNVQLEKFLKATIPICIWERLIHFTESWCKLIIKRIMFPTSICFYNQ